MTRGLVLAAAIVLASLPAAGADVGVGACVLGGHVESNTTAGGPDVFAGAGFSAGWPFVSAYLSEGAFDTACPDAEISAGVAVMLA